MDSLRNALKIKSKDVRTIVYQETVIHDTLHDTIPLTMNFTARVSPNELTTIDVIREDTILTVIPDIRNEQTLFITSEKKYKHKTFFGRLIRLSFKKDIIEKYYINNSNDLIDNYKTSVVTIDD